jgi:hypothetical protein
MVNAIGFRSRVPGWLRLRRIIGGRQQVRGDLPRLGGVEEVLAVKADGLSSRRESVESQAVRPASSRAGICPFGVR